MIGSKNKFIQGRLTYFLTGIIFYQWQKKITMYSADKAVLKDSVTLNLTLSISVVKNF
jgi:hypothetical protein